MNMGRKFSQVNIEAVSSYWNERPCNIRHSPLSIGSKEYFDQVEKRKYFVEPHILRFAEFSKWKNKKVLEIGCGIGTDTINFARNGAFVTAVELSEKSMQIAMERAKVYNLQDRITFVKANAEELSRYLPVSSFDLIYSFGVIHHTPHPEKAIEELRKYTNKDSVFKFMVYNRYSWKVFAILLTYGKGQFWKLKEMISRYSEAQEGCPVTYAYTPKEVRELLNDKGFKVDDLFTDHIFPYSISEYIQYKYKKIWYFDLLSESVFRFLEKKIGWHICVTAKPM